MNPQRVQRQLKAWLAGKLVVGRTLREGLGELKNRNFISVHIDELMGRRWRPGKIEMLETSLIAFELLRKRFGRKAVLRIFLKLPIRKTRFSVRSKLTKTLVKSRMREVQRYNEPPEAFVYARRP